MNTSIIKSASTISFIVCAITLPYIAKADTDVFSGRGAFGDMGGSNGTLSFSMSAFENASKSKSEKANASGASIWADNYTEDACWAGFASTNTIQIDIQATGQIPKRITASGSVQMTWNDWCGHNDPFTEELSFNMDLKPMTEQANFSYGTLHKEYGNIKYNTHYDNANAPAEVGATSFITSPRFGTVSPDEGNIGQSKQHEIYITKQP